jgi:hypothetical protein
MKITAENGPSIAIPILPRGRRRASRAARAAHQSKPKVARPQPGRAPPRIDVEEAPHGRREILGHGGECPQSKKTFRTPALEGLREPAPACGDLLGGEPFLAKQGASEMLAAGAWGSIDHGVWS